MAEADDEVGRLAAATTELCRLYFNALGNLQNSAPEAALHDPPQHATACPPHTHQLADEIVRAHRDLGARIDALERAERSEAEHAERIEALQRDDDALAARLREKLAEAAELRARLRTRLQAVDAEVARVSQRRESDGA